jgi:septal ring factor EnvC (AmiA/AmiB activator)
MRLFSVVSFLLTAGVVVTCAEQDPMADINNKFDVMMMLHEKFVATWRKELQQTKDELQQTKGELSLTKDELSKVKGELQQTKLQLQKHKHHSSDCRTKFTPVLTAYMYSLQPRCDGDEYMTSLIFHRIKGKKRHDDYSYNFEYSCCKVGVWDQ